MSSLSLTTLVATLLGFPLLVILLGEIALRLRLRGKAFATSVLTLRNVVLPLVAIYILLVKVANVPAESTVNKLFITFSMIIGLVALLGIINGLLFERNTESKVPKLFLDLGRILVICLGIALTLSLIWGYDLSNLITALGVSSIVLGLALQDTLGNLFNGITLINEQPFQVGDYIEVEGHAGQVVEVNWRAVRLLTRERDLIVLPHIKVSQSAILNHSRPEQHWAEKLTLGFSYDHPPNQVKRVLRETCLATSGILHHPPPELKVDDFADSAVVYEVEYYIKNYGEREEVRDDFMSRVWYAAKRNNFSIPFPQVNLHREPQRDKEKQEQTQRLSSLTYAARMLKIPDEAESFATNRGVSVLSFGEGEPLIDQGISAPGLYFLLSGEVKMSSADPNGEAITIAELHRGDLVTEIMLPGSRKNVVSVVATEDCQAVYLDDSTLRRLVNRYPKLANTVEEVLNNRRRQLRKLRK